MRTLKPVSLNKRGFSLLELILTIAIGSMLFTCLYSLLFYAMRVCEISDQKDISLTNGRYAILYIKEEVKNADKIIHISKFKDLDEGYPENIGFVIQENKILSSGKLNYNYKTYYLKGDQLVRLACNLESYADYPSKAHFSGHNEVCRGLDSLEKFIYDRDKNILKIKISLNQGTKDFEFKSDVFLTCPLDLDSGG